MIENERRFASRVPLNMLLQIKFDSRDSFKAEYASNISTNGIFIKTTTPHKIGSMIYLQFQLTDSSLLEGLGRVVHINPPASEHPGMGVEFVNLDPDSETLISSIVNERHNAST